MVIDLKIFIFAVTLNLSNVLIAGGGAARETPATVRLPEHRECL
jgi:hypothetical protein